MTGGAKASTSNQQPTEAIKAPEVDDTARRKTALRLTETSLRADASAAELVDVLASMGLLNNQRKEWP